MLETVAETDALKAVVSEGAGARTFSEDMDQDSTAAEKVLGAPLSAIKTASIAVCFANQPPATNLKQLVGMFAPRPLFSSPLRTARTAKISTPGCYEAADESKTLWEILQSRHVGGLAARCEEDERRVIGFFDQALRR